MQTSSQVDAGTAMAAAPASTRNKKPFAISHDIDERDALEPNAVGHVLDEVARRESRGLPAQQRAADDGAGREDDGRDEGGPLRQRAGCDRTRSLRRVGTVGSDVADVIERVDRAGERAEREDRDRAAHQVRHVGEPAGKHQRRRHEQ